MANQRYRLYRMYNDGEFRGTVDAAALFAANGIRYEADTVPNHEARVALADVILGEETPDRRRAIERFSLEAALNPTILTAAYPGGSLDVSAIPDSDLDYVVAATWDDIALTLFPQFAEAGA